MGAVVAVILPDGAYAFGRVLRDAAVAFYGEFRPTATDPPIGSRMYEFVVGMYDDALAGLPVVGHDPAHDEADEWPPSFSVTDPLSGRKSVYYRGEVRPATPEECAGLEPAAVWDLAQIVDRLEAVRAATKLRRPVSS